MNFDSLPRVSRPERPAMASGPSTQVVLHHGDGGGADGLSTITDLAWNRFNRLTAAILARGETRAHDDIEGWTLPGDDACCGA